MTPDDTLLIEELRRDEAVMRRPYLDTKGVLTVGVGHNLEAKPLPDGWNYPLTDVQIDQLLAEDLQSVFTDLDGNFSWWRGMEYTRQRVLANMCFNLGIVRLLKFKNTLAAMSQGRYTAAAAGMMASLWATQVGGRAERLSRMLEDGNAYMA